jgi:hypothetical protein
MPTAAPSPPDLTTLDRRIEEALGVLRLARLRSAWSLNAAATRDEEAAQRQLDALLEYRHTAASGR